ncbi:zinc ribbon domain-containing protein [Thermomicrobium sp. 4228-Ro]|uniref:FmdB family zinc ribbon protein n=1 Tax=Thermomicrobium sp. 4228-Ro TaxID=2993937 RepID=UPI0022490BBD|nr:zinc ribbon domain-containing protein [Thermomicrobium sp. 4228-Ro]MCX2726149.1 zinc ribbon domain-containing protein [Thermomicrobium sp. 4228-Ro]
MPVYEYRCRACRRRFTKFFRSFASVTDPDSCPYCGAVAVERVLSRVIVRRQSVRDEALVDDWQEDESLSGATEEWDDEPDLPDVPDSEDPREFARWAREMAAHVGEPLDPAFERALADLERGEDPDRVLERLEEETAESAVDVSNGESEQLD